MLDSILLAIGWLSSLYIFYKLVRDDVKLISLKLTESVIFDMFLSTFLVSILGGRAIFVISNLSSFPISPLNFILIPYHPGLSVTGTVSAGLIFLLVFLKRKHILKIRIFDLAALSALPIFVLGFLGKLHLIEMLVFAILSFFLVRSYKDPMAFPRINFQGSILSIFLAVYSLVIFVGFVPKKLLTLDSLLAIITFTFAIYLLGRGLIKGYI